MLFFPLCVFSQWQLLQGVGCMVIRQDGLILTTPRDTNFFESTKVDRKLFAYGGTMSFFYRIPLSSPVPGKIIIGPQTGIGFYFTRPKKSIDPTYQPDPGKKRLASGTFHVPLEISVRTGCLANPYGRNFGISVAGGLDMFRLRIPDEKAFALLPCGTIVLIYKKTGIRFSMCFMDFHSSYNSNLGEVARLTSSIKSFEIVRLF